MTDTAIPVIVTPARVPVPLALRRLATAEVEALAEFAHHIGLTVTPDVQHPSGPRFVVSAPAGKAAVLTLAGRDSPAATVLWLHPPRAATGGARAALLSMRVSTTTPNGT